MFKKLLIISLLLLSIPNKLDAQVLSSYGVVSTSLSTSSAGVVTGTPFAVPLTYSTLITWTITSDSATLAVNLEGSVDNVSWFTIDSNTTTGIKNYGFTSIRFVRISQVSRTGGTTTAATLVTARGFVAGTNNLISGTKFQAGNGTAAAPSYSFTSEPSFGFYRAATSELALANINATGGTPANFAPSQLKLGNVYTLGWTAINSAVSPADTGISRLSAASIAIGNGTAGDTTGIITASSYRATANISTSTNGSFSWNSETKSRISSTVDGIMNMSNAAGTIGSTFKVDALPTVSACGAGTPSVVAGSTPMVGSVTIGTTAVATCTITFNGTAFPNAPHCSGVVETTTPANVRAMGYSATTTVLTIVPSAAWVDSSVVNWQCFGPK